MDSFEHLFESYWWLVFPLFWMVAGVIGNITNYRHKSDMLKLIKSYADQGKDPPPALLDAIRSDEARAHDYDGYYGRRRWRRNHYRGGWWWQVAVFASMATGFGYFGYYGGGPQVFIALALAFGVAATVLTILGVVRALTNPRIDDRDLKD